ncbi:hypothetical protein Q669_31995 [Labrenzia sp. C1B10]|uniref:hypothetical protein n=1 Tax=unclassified Labrenzia TaxID=2648686 RepID=UPI0003B836BC|nr:MULTISPECIES: hypothetical protein [unclassified Labrenzia]ERP91223.1 hypothetical protein Q669_31995 [Labrenzia sp. C1B10]ERS04180.1 hypothetical protein Q675_30795 [Labrenzia sp. C1B70]
MTDNNAVNPDRLAAKLQKLRGEYGQRIPERLQEIEFCWSSYVYEKDPVVLTDLTSKVHMLSGTATMYGFGVLGSHAEAAEDSLVAIHETPEGFSIAEAAIRSLVADRSFEE